MKHTLLGLASAALLAPAAFAQDTVLYIDSYHEGYHWSDQIRLGIEETFAGSDVNLVIHYMDTKRNSSPEFLEDAAATTVDVIAEINPDLVIAADDNAQSLVVVPHLLDTETPVVFAGVNWDASPYGYPAYNVTGMVEVSPTLEVVEMLAGVANGIRIGFLSNDTVTSRKEFENSDTVLGLEMDARYVSTFEDWQAEYLALQSEVDMLILYDVVGVEGFNMEDAIAFVDANTRVPSGTVVSQLRELVLISVEKLGSEQGSWAASTALDILAGVPPSSVPVVTNTEGAISVNDRLSAASGIAIPSFVRGVADLVIASN